MSKAISEETQQFLTVAFGGVVLVMGLLAYNNNPNSHSAHLPPANAGLRAYLVVKAALPFILVAFTILVAMRYGGKAREMARNVVIVVSLIAVIHAVLVTPSPGGSGTKWEQVSADVTTPLSAGALFALPIMFY